MWSRGSGNAVREGWNALREVMRTEGTDFGQSRFGHPDMTNYTMREKKNEIGGGRRKKKREIWGGLVEGGPPEGVRRQGGPGRGVRRKVVQTNNHTTNTNHNKERQTTRRNNKHTAKHTPTTIHTNTNHNTM